MIYRIFSKAHPDGVIRDGSFVPGEIEEVVKAKGVYRGACPCCDKVIVVRYAGEGAGMSMGDEHFLLHDGGGEL